MEKSQNIMKPIDGTKSIYTRYKILFDKTGFSLNCLAHLHNAIKLNVPIFSCYERLLIRNIPIS